MKCKIKNCKNELFNDNISLCEDHYVDMLKWLHKEPNNDKLLKRIKVMKNECKR